MIARVCGPLDCRDLGRHRNNRLPARILQLGSRTATVCFNVGFQKVPRRLSLFHSPTIKDGASLDSSGQDDFARSDRETQSVAAVNGWCVGRHRVRRLLSAANAMHLMTIVPHQVDDLRDLPLIDRKQRLAKGLLGRPEGERSGSMNI
jgi:hypothetical protein